MERVAKHIVLDVPVDALTLEGLLRRVDTAIGQARRERIMYANIHCLNTAYRDKRLRDIYSRADTIYCDGAGVVLGARLIGGHLPNRMTGADWIHDLCAMCAGNGYSLFLLGGRPGIGEKAAARLEKEYPELRIAGVHHGYLNAVDNKELVASINRCRPDILLVGMGTPLQEYWIDENFEKLEVPIVWAMGALMDFVSGQVRRAPGWMLNNGLEWLFRLLLEPRRMYRRYVLGNVLFMYRLLNSRQGGGN